MQTEDLFTHILQCKESRASKAQMIAEKICRTMNYSWAGLYDVSATTIRMIACHGHEPVFTEFPVDKGLNGRAVTAKEIVVVNDIEKDPDYLLTFRKTQSEIIIPVFISGEHIAGTIDVESEHKNAFGEKDIEFLSACAKSIRQLWQ